MTYRFKGLIPCWDEVEVQEQSKVAASITSKKGSRALCASSSTVATSWR